MHRSLTRQALTRQALPLVAGASLVVGSLVVGSLGTAGAAQAAVSHPNTVFSIGVGQGPSLAIGPDGTGFVAFDHQSGANGGSDDSVVLCRIPRGTHGCASTTTIPLSLSSSGHGPAVFVTGPNQIQILSTRCCDAGAPTGSSPYLQLITSTDNGATFGAPVTVALNVPSDLAVPIGGGKFVAITEESEYGLSVAEFGPAGAAIPPAQQPITSDVYGGTIATTSDGGLLAAHYDSAGSGPNTLTVQRWTPAAGDPSLPASWTTVFTAPGSLTHLAGGPHGTFLLDDPDGSSLDSSRYEVRRWTGSSFSAPVIVSGSGADNAEANLSEDPAGTLHLIYRGDSGDLYQRTSGDGTHWSKALDLAASSSFGFYNNVDRTLGDGGGFDTFDSDSNGTVYAIAIPIGRTVGTHVNIAKHKVQGSVHPSKKGQPVLLQEKSGKHWVTVTHSSVDAHGSFTFSVPKHKKSIALRVIAPVVEGYLEADGGSVGVK